MRINKDTRNAVVALSCLYGKYTSKQAMRLQQISDNSDIAVHTLVQLFHKLKIADIVKSVRGPGGGYFLNIKHKDLTMAQMISAIEGDVIVHSCKGKRNCNKGKECQMHRFWTNISTSIDSALSSIPVLNPDYNPIILKEQKL